MDYSLGEYIAKSITDFGQDDFAVKVKGSEYNDLPAGYHTKKTFLTGTKVYFKKPSEGEVVDIDKGLRDLERLKHRGLISDQLYNRSKEYLYDRDEVAQDLEYGSISNPSGTRMINMYDAPYKQLKLLSKLDKRYIKDVKTINKLDKRMPH